MGLKRVSTFRWSMYVCSPFNEVFSYLHYSFATAVEPTSAPRSNPIAVSHLHRFSRGKCRCWQYFVVSAEPGDRTNYWLQRRCRQLRESATAETQGNYSFLPHDVRFLKNVSDLAIPYQLLLILAYTLDHRGLKTRNFGYEVVSLWSLDWRFSRGDTLHFPW